MQHSLRISARGKDQISERTQVASFHEQLHFRTCQGKSQWAPRNTSLQKKKVTHRPSPALSHTSTEVGETIVTAPQTRPHAVGFARGKLTSTQTPAASAHELSDTSCKRSLSGINLLQVPERFFSILLKRSTIRGKQVFKIERSDLNSSEESVPDHRQCTFCTTTPDSFFQLVVAPIRRQAKKKTLATPGTN